MSSLRHKPEDTPADTIDTPQPTESETPKPVESENPVDAAAKPDPVSQAADASALKARLSEMDLAQQIEAEQFELQRNHAEQIQNAPQQQPTYEQMYEHLPPRMQRFLEEHREALSTPEGAAHAQYLHHRVGRELGEVYSDAYFDKMDEGFGSAEQASERPKGNGSENHDTPSPKPSLRPASPPAPQRGEQRLAPAGQQAPQRGPVGGYAAPPSRENISLSTGRPMSRITLTADEQQIASKMIGAPAELSNPGAIIKTQAEANKEYAMLKRDMLELKAKGVIQGDN